MEVMRTIMLETEDEISKLKTVKENPVWMIDVSLV